MKSRLLIMAVSILVAGGVRAIGQEPSSFGEDFRDTTLRVDFFHTGNAAEELLTLDVLSRQGRWAGSQSALIDASPLGRYVVRLHDAESRRLLFSRGFDSLFGEYRTTSDALAGKRRTYHETVLIPLPRRTATLVFSSRTGNGTTTELAEFAVDPESPNITDEPPVHGVTVIEAVERGDPHHALDVAIIGEGYTSDEIGLFRDDLTRFAAVLLKRQPFAESRARISIRGVLMPSAEPRCDEPTRGLWRDTALGASFNALGSPRYLLTENNRALRDIAANVPYDALVIMVNHSRYGGGGIYRAYCVFTAHNVWSDYLLVHEFGHSFGGLADEYYTSSVAYSDFYPAGIEPAEANITALLDPPNLKWLGLISPRTPIPTPWDKTSFDALELAYQERRRELDKRIGDANRSGAPAEEIYKLEQSQERLSIDHTKQVQELLENDRSAGVVGAFEGAGYASTGLYRPEISCIMFTRARPEFCRVCGAAIAGEIQRHTE
jgi:hypothetical protein